MAVECKSSYHKQIVPPRTKFECGDRVLIRSPGLTLKLESKWDGLYIVVDAPNDIPVLDIHVLVSGESVADRTRGRCRQLHVSLVKPFKEREVVVYRLLVAATDQPELGKNR